MIDWRPISSQPPMVTVDDKPLWVGSRSIPTVRRSAYVLIWRRCGKWGRDRVCMIDGEPRPFSELYGFDITHWSAVNSPIEGTT